MATYIKPEAIQDVSKQAKKKLKSYISPKPIIVGRAIPRNAEVGDRYYTTGSQLIIKLPEELRTIQNAGVYRSDVIIGSYNIFKVPSNWPELYDLIIQAIQQGTTDTIASIIGNLQNQGYIKVVPNFTSTTACPNVMIENGRLVYNKEIVLTNTQYSISNKDIEHGTDAEASIESEILIMFSAKSTYKIYHFKKAAKRSGLKFGGPQFERPTIKNVLRTYNKNYKTVRNSIIVVPIWRKRIKSRNAIKIQKYRAKSFTHDFVRYKIKRLTL